MNPNQATVRHTPLKHAIPQSLSIIDTICTTGAQSPDVQASPVALQALTALEKAVTTSHTSTTARLNLAAALITAIKTMKGDYAVVKAMLATYESAVNTIANGSATVINKAGLLTRAVKPPAATLTAVTVVHSKPGKSVGAAILTWPAADGATSYAIEVNFTPQSPTGTWTALNSGSSRRRVVKAPTPTAGFQMLARVASQGSDGTQADWSPAILVTTL